MTFAPTLMTWVVSALWHGLYPGYHMSFIVFALATVTARKVSSYHIYLSYQERIIVWEGKCRKRGSVKLPRI